MLSLRGGDVICVKNAIAAMPVPRKLWLISGRELRRLGTKGAAELTRTEFLAQPHSSSEDTRGVE
jgi:hypothetical protein